MTIYLAGNKYPFTKCISWINSNYIWAAAVQKKEMPSIWCRRTLYLTSGENKTCDSVIKGEAEKPYFFLTLNHLFLFSCHFYYNLSVWCSWQKVQACFRMNWLRTYFRKPCFIDGSLGWLVVYHWLWNIKKENWYSEQQKMSSILIRVYFHSIILFKRWHCSRNLSTTVRITFCILVERSVLHQPITHESTIWGKKNHWNQMNYDGVNV